MTPRQVWLVQLLTATTPLPGLDRIGYRYVLPRDPRRDPERLKRDLARAYVEHRKHDYAPDSEIISVRRTRLHLVRRTA